ncbi:MAG: DUF2975 domain-containing protein [Flavobacteriales bacterium]|jgi:hypothetical protein|tara:strand:+ start:119 stop:616 length:498 start_codon:yes stop_codon:yes gene_type:complete
MKKSFLFKSLVDYLYILNVGGFLLLLITISFGFVEINEIKGSDEDWSVLAISISCVSALTCIVFLRGVYYLRKIARHLLTNKYFSKQIIKYLKISGTHFLLAGVMFVVIMILRWIGKLRVGLFEFVYDTNLMVPLFLMIIGLFFMIQSEALLVAKNFKEENDLTV